MRGTDEAMRDELLNETLSSASTMRARLTALHMRCACLRSCAAPPKAEIVRCAAGIASLFRIVPPSCVTGVQPTTRYR